MVSSFLISPAYVGALNKHAHYELFLLTPATKIGALLPVGHLWFHKRTKTWKNTLRVGVGYLLMKINGFAVGTMYVEQRVVLKMELYEPIVCETDSTSSSIADHVLVF